MELEEGEGRRPFSARRGRGALEVRRRLFSRSGEDALLCQEQEGEGAQPGGEGALVPGGEGALLCQEREGALSCQEEERASFVPGGEGGRRPLCQERCRERRPLC